MNEGGNILKKTIFLVLVISLSPLFAGNHFGIKGGINTSTFYDDDDSAFLRGYSYGINYEYSFMEHYYIGTGLYYSKIGGWLKNKVLIVEHLETLGRIDIRASAGYLIIPLNVGYLLNVKKNYLFKVYTGYSYLFPFIDYTYRDDKYVINDSIDPDSNIDYDFRSIGRGESVFPTGKYANSAINLGAAMVYKRYCLDLSMHYQMDDFGTFDNLSKIKKSLITFEMLLGLYF
ncbi:MAG: outer membrane beta-barrel protein [Caldithrix sp.]|nr:outer membrane beta-barrel protein [Caldithrix sp.]